MKKRDIKNHQKQYERAVQSQNKSTNNSSTEKGLTKCQIFVNELIKADQKVSSGLNAEQSENVATCEEKARSGDEVLSN